MDASRGIMSRTMDRFKMVIDLALFSLSYLGQIMVIHLRLIGSKKMMR